MCPHCKKKEKHQLHRRDLGNGHYAYESFDYAKEKKEANLHQPAQESLKDDEPNKG